MSSVKDSIVEAAFILATSDGYDSLTRDGVAAKAGVSKGSINHHFSTISDLRDEVMRTAIERVNLAIIGHGLAVGNPIAKSAPDDIKRQALDTLL